MNFENRQQEVERVDESEIVPNRYIFVSIVGQEIEEKVPLKLLILTPTKKLSTIAFRWDFISSFSCVCVPDIISNFFFKVSEQDVDQVLYSAMAGRKCDNK